MFDTYPTSDGKPFAESDWHFAVKAGLIAWLGGRFANDSSLYVSGDLLVYYEEGNKRKRIAPDVFAVRGVEKKLRENYLTWQEKKGLDLVIEMTSAKTRREHARQKDEVYRDILKVQELFHFDLFAEYLNPRLQGHRLRDGEYVPIQPDEGRLYSEVLGLWLEPSGMNLLLVDPALGAASPEARERAKGVETDVLELLREIRDLRKKYEKTRWRRQ